MSNFGSHPYNMHSNGASWGFTNPGQFGRQPSLRPLHGGRRPYGPYLTQTSGGYRGDCGYKRPNNSGMPFQDVQVPPWRQEQQRPWNQGFQGGQNSYYSAIEPPSPESFQPKRFCSSGLSNIAGGNGVGSDWSMQPGPYQSSSRGFQRGTQNRAHGLGRSGFRGQGSQGQGSGGFESGGHGIRPPEDSKSPSTMQVLNYLSSCKDHTASLAEIKKAFSFRAKKEVNQDLYFLEKQGIARKLQDTPPIWQLLPQGVASVIPSAKSVHSFGDPSRTSLHPEAFVMGNSSVQVHQNSARGGEHSTRSDAMCISGDTTRDLDNTVDVSRLEVQASNSGSNFQPGGSAESQHQMQVKREFLLAATGQAEASTSIKTESAEQASTEVEQQRRIGFRFPSSVGRGRGQLLLNQMSSSVRTKGGGGVGRGIVPTQPSGGHSAAIAPEGSKVSLVLPNSVQCSKFLESLMASKKRSASAVGSQLDRDSGVSGSDSEDTATTASDLVSHKSSSMQVDKTGGSDPTLIASELANYEHSASLAAFPNAESGGAEAMKSMEILILPCAAHGNSDSSLRCAIAYRALPHSSAGGATSGDGAFKVPLPPKQLIASNPVFAGSGIGVAATGGFLANPRPLTDLLPSSAARSRVVGGVCAWDQMLSDDNSALVSTSYDITGQASKGKTNDYGPDLYHSLPVCFDNIVNVGRDSGATGLGEGSQPRGPGLPRSGSLDRDLDGRARAGGKNPFATALRLEADDDDDDQQMYFSLDESPGKRNEFGGDFTNNRSEFWSGQYLAAGNLASGGFGAAGNFQGAPGSVGGVTGESFAALNKNCISALMEYAQSRHTEAQIVCIDSQGPSHKPKFKMAVKMGSRWFPYIESTNKKDGKKEAADVALRTLMAEGSYQSMQSAALPLERLGVSATHFDRVASLAHHKFNQLAATILESMVGKKVLAAFVMTTGQQGDPGTVISVGTGNRCITGTFLSLEGQTVNDSHAEVICRRGLMRFLYRQLLEYSPDHQGSIFEPSRPTQAGGAGAEPNRRLKVRDGVEFHLYISTAPCGDGALFSPRDIGPSTGSEPGSAGEHEPTFTNKAQGKLRTKMEGGEGTIPVEGESCAAQSWDGILRGERLRTMSCSDKVCRWNLVGLQGALLSHFIDPVYMASLTLGFLYDHGHLSRAICCRLSHCTAPPGGNNSSPDLSPATLPSHYKVNHPKLGRVTAYEPIREVQKTKELSLNWAHGDTEVEVTDGTKGICVAAKNGQTSQTAKCSLYASFRRACAHLSRADLIQSCATYRDAKRSATEFRAARDLMFAKFKADGHGTWVSKPAEEEMFTWAA